MGRYEIWSRSVGSFPFFYWTAPICRSPRRRWKLCHPKFAEGAQALKRAGDGQDFTINPPENGVRRPLPFLGWLSVFILQT